MGIGSWVEVRYELIDQGWVTTVEGTSGESSLFGSAVKAVEIAIEEALVDLAAQAIVVFSSDEFHAAIR